MISSPRKGPRQHSPAREAFEYAVQQGNAARVESIIADEHIEDTIVAFNKSQESLPSLIDALLSDKSADIQVLDKLTPTDDWTDVLRYSTGASFMIERIVLPLTINRQGTHEHRRLIANGILGKTLDLIEPLVEYVDHLNLKKSELSTHFDAQLKRVRGWIQEMTIMALINYAQSADCIALPASTIQDLEEHTDLILYLRKRGVAYNIPISIKSSSNEARKEERAHPNVCVISAAEIENLGLSTTRLLLKQHIGHPGITKDEEDIIREARDVVMVKISQWMNARIKNNQERNMLLGRAARTAQ